MIELMSDKGVYRTDPATPGLLKAQHTIVVKYFSRENLLPAKEMAATTGVKD